ncbi:NnrS family protein [Azonexus sp.]|uniref:NnrS family protein n=1 Tax=Azonexus sp. TaxID=1872668 RepID=UPI0039E3E363
MMALYARQAPVWMCGFRAFFLAAAALAVALLLWWVGFLLSGAALALPDVPGGPFVWHAHELIFGFAVAALAGFALTAFPEFTNTPSIAACTVRRLFGLWLLGRVSFWCSGFLGAPALLLAGLAQLALLGGLLYLLGPRLFHAPDRRHFSFAWALCALAVTLVGFYLDALRGLPPGRWLYAALGVFMIFIVLAMSRISMRIMNDALEAEAVRRGEANERVYRSRPPKRNLAVTCIAAYTAAEFFLPGERLGGWLALASMAALLHLQSDWHIGRALLRRWPLILLSAYFLMAGGYALMAWDLLLGSGSFSAGRHLLTVGGLGIAVYAVLNIAGRIHSGHPLDERPWVAIGALALILGALLRAATAWPGAPVTFLWAASGLCWGAAYGLWLWFMFPILSAARTDGGTGCEEILLPEEKATKA